MVAGENDEGAGLVGRWRWNWPQIGAVILLAVLVLAYLLAGYL